jgi:hypothetical protein
MDFLELRIRRSWVQILLGALKYQGNIKSKGLLCMMLSIIYPPIQDFRTFNK